MLGIFTVKEKYLIGVDVKNCAVYSGPQYQSFRNKLQVKRREATEF